MFFFHERLLRPFLSWEHILLFIMVRKVVLYINWETRGTKANKWRNHFSCFHVKYIFRDKTGRRKMIMAPSQISYQRKSRYYQLHTVILSTTDTYNWDAQAWIFIPLVAQSQWFIFPLSTLCFHYISTLQYATVCAHDNLFQAPDLH